MGGLDCRLLASDPSWSRQIISLTTIGTPHFGTCLADLATSRLRHLLNGLEWLGLDVDGIHQVSTENMRKLTSDWSEPERTVCMSIAGNPMAEDTFFLMRPTRSWIFDRQGPNDGMVPMESALGWGEPLPPWNLDHLSQINWITPSHLHTELYQSYFLLMKKLAETEMNYSSRTIVASPDFEVIST
jgi:triacylglycerol lipase